MSPLEVDQGADANDSLAPSTGTRRGKRDQVARPQSYSLTDTNNVLARPFVLVVLVIQAAYQIMTQFIGDPVGHVREFFTVNREANAILKDVPVLQQEQRRQLEHIHEGQVDQRQKLEVLRRRVQALEARRAARENNDIPDLSKSPDGKEIKSE